MTRRQLIVQGGAALFGVALVSTRQKRKKLRAYRVQTPGYCSYQGACFHHEGSNPWRNVGPEDSSPRSLIEVDPEDLPAGLETGIAIFGWDDGTSRRVDALFRTASNQLYAIAA